MLRGAADLVDFGELAGDHVGHDVAGVETDPDLKSGIAQVRDAPDQLDGRMAGQRSMVVVSDRCTKYRRHAVAQLLADDSSKLAYRPSHSGQSRLEARDSLLRLQFGNKPGGIDDVGPENCHKSSFAVRIDALAHRRSAFGAPAVARINRRLTREAMHSCASNDCRGSPAPAPARRLALHYRTGDAWQSGLQGGSSPDGGSLDE